MKKILWLASWYPNRLEPFNGDFVERHARAASLHHKITVLFLIKDASLSIPGKYHIEEKQYNDNFSAYILYYKPACRIGVIDSLLAGIRYFIFFSGMIRRFIDTNGRPDLVHVQVAWRAGLLALYCKWRYKLKYAISEHWTIFIPGARPGFSQKNFVVRNIVRKIYKNASGCSAVSEQLAGALRERFGISGLSGLSVIPNVVDTALFRPSESESECFRFIHISEFNYQKNPEAIFEALRLLKSSTAKRFEVLVFAPDEEIVNALAMQYAIGEVIRFRNYVPQEVLSLEMNSSGALLLYSRFETFGCVVIEAMASGIPVIVSDIPVMHEIVKKDMGVIVPANAPALLAEKMLWMMDNSHQFNSAALAAYAEKNYGCEKIGKLFDAFYNAI